MRRAALLILVAACGDGDGTPAVDAVDSPPPGDAAPDAPDFPRSAGLVSLGFNANVMDTSMQAGFYKTSAGGTGCLRRREGPCHVTTCDAMTAGIYAVSAGTVTAAMGSASFSAEPDANGLYFGASGGAGFPPGSVMSVSASGADVPAFSRELVIPPVVAVTEPATTDGVIIDRAQPYTVRWTPGDGDVYVYFDSMGDGIVYPLTTGTTLRCVVPSSGGEATVPASLLGELPAGMAVLAVAAIDQGVMDVSGFAIEVRAIAYQLAGLVTMQ